MPKIRVRYSNGKKPSCGFDMAIEGTVDGCLAILDEARKGINTIEKREAKP